MITNKSILCILIFFVSITYLFSQIGIGSGTPYIYNEQPIPLANRNHKTAMELSYNSIILERKLSKKVTIQNVLFQYRGASYFHFGDAFLDKDKQNGLKIWGVYLTDIQRNDLIIKYDFKTFFKTFTISSISGLSYLKSEPNGFSPFSRSSSLIGPIYSLNDDIKGKGFKNTQWIPLLGVEFDIKIWKFNVFVNILGAKGFKAHQRLYFPYTYYGMQQPTAISENRGSGIFTNIGIKTNWLQPNFEI
jgi:hypothetical protein